MKRLRSLLVLASSCAIVAGCGGGGAPDESPTQPTPQPSASLPDSAKTQIKALIAEKNARTPAQRKISSQLLYARSGTFKAVQKAGRQKAGDDKAPVERLNRLIRYDDQGRVLVDVRGDLAGGLVREIENLDGTVVTSSAQYNSVRAWLALDRLESLAALNYVRSVRPAAAAQTSKANPTGMPQMKISTGRSFPARAAAVKEQLQQVFQAPGGATTNVGLRQTQGDSAHKADRARKFYNTDGTGVRVGVLSDSDDFKEQSIASGDLRPDTITIPGQDGRPGTGEGTAMMEIIQDIAPGAQLVFATAFLSPESFADNIRRLRFEYGCDVIVDDVIYFAESPYQDDIIAQAVNDVTNDGALYFSSAGNQGNYTDGFAGTWEGDFSSAGRLSTLEPIFDYTVNNFDFHGDKVPSNRVEFSGGPVILQWSDPSTFALPQSSNDYDLFILSEDLRTVFDASTDIQDGDDLAFEGVGIAFTGEHVVVARAAGAQVRALHLVVFGGELAISTPGGIYGHAAADMAVATAAVDQAMAINGVFEGGPTTQVELFSTDGHRRIFYKPNGTRMGGGVTFASGGGQFRPKPELTAADGVQTNTPGFQPFFGTSAAAPHAAGIAALMKSAVPSNGAWRIRQSMIDTAIDIEGPGFDRDSGHGVVDAMKAMQASGAKPKVFLELGTINVTPAGGASSVNPGGGGSLSIQLVNNGGANATSVSATLTSGTPGVTVTQGSSAYPNLPNSGGNGTNATPYAFTVDGSVPCGTLLEFTLTANYSGTGPKPVSFSVPVQTGAPGAPVVTSYAGPVVPIPDASAAGVDIPLTVSGAPASVSKVVFSIDGSACSATTGSTTVGIDHTWVGDIVATLRSPGGTSVSLMSRPGGTLNSGNNFCQTVLDDDAANSIQSITSAQNPFTGTFRPASPLSAFNGEDANGVWTLNISDNAGFDTGSVRAFSIRTSGFVCTP